MKKTMKRVALFILAVSMGLSLMACVQNEPSSSENIPSDSIGSSSGDLTPRVYQVASGSSTGAYYLQITPIAALWEQLDFVQSCSVQATTGALENTVLVSTGAADAGLVDSFAFIAAQDGTDPYTEPYGGYSAVAAGAPSLCTIIVRADSDIYSISDLAGHSIAVGLAGSGAEYEERFMLEALGMTYDDFSQVDMVGIGPGLTNFQDGKVDAVILLGGAGNSSVMEAMTNVDVRFLGFSDAELETVLETCPYYEADVIPAGSYEGLTEDIQTVSIACLLVVSDNLPEEAVYQMTEKIYTNIEDLKSSNVNFEEWTFGEGCTGDIPLHPGALKYYNENNITFGS